MKSRSCNPIAFRPIPVTVITATVYSALIIALLVVHLAIPSAPKTSTPARGINLTEAWLDLRILSQFYHPYNSRENDHVRNWLLGRIEGILRDNGALSEPILGTADGRSTSDVESSVVVFSDMISNISFSENSHGLMPGLSIYFEGTNIIVYIRGSNE